MTTETATNPAADDASRVAAGVGVADDGQAAGGDQSTDGADDQDEDLDPEANLGDGADDTDEIEHDGKKYRIPKALNGALMMNKDYTQKTQAIAARTSELVAREAELTQQAEAQEALAKDHARVVALDDRIAWYESQNWTALQAQDPDRAQQLWMAYQQEKLGRDTAAKEFETKKTAHLDKVRQADATRLQKVDAELSDPEKGIKGWGPELFRGLVGFAQSHGIAPATLGAADAAQWKILHLAFVGSKALSKQTSVQRHVDAQATSPAITVGARSAPPPRLSDRQPTDAWMKDRNAQVRKKA